ncbi:MAG: ABC transporter ATP-binding protein [archaeon]
MPIPIIKLENVKKSYSGNIVLNGINLEINAGEIFGIIGASGAGKTTLLRMLSEFIYPDEGSMLIKLAAILKPEDQNQNFEPIEKVSNKYKRLVGYASQTPSLYLNLSTKENLSYFGTLYNLPGKVISQNIKTLLDLMELSGFENTLSKNLSGGMQRRLDIACALIHDPRILILDEPTADLDPLLSRHIWSMIQSINKKGTTIIVSSHHVMDLENACTRIGVLKQGNLIHIGTIQHFLNEYAGGQEIHIETYPGNYDKLLLKITTQGITKKENRGTEIVFHTLKPEAVLPKLLSDIEKNDETLIDIRLQKPSLDDLFKKKEIKI